MAKSRKPAGRPSTADGAPYLLGLLECSDWVQVSRSLAGRAAVTLASNHIAECDKPKLRRAVEILVAAERNPATASVPQLMMAAHVIGAICEVTNTAVNFVQSNNPERARLLRKMNPREQALMNAVRLSARDLNGSAKLYAKAGKIKPAVDKILADKNHPPASVDEIYRRLRKLLGSAL
jgi:hypothetical protein